ncbi:hypothetical protein CLPU_1c01530 [Gottschalkia purinilytica]|uniref:Uncharacterized protein n=1 Tax=Gottschalkia purinilytica TaxID=1503 RepID=A0A0L0WET7_GOTPU|nr:hypothetical protein CLPU_1c01530 [Gottschalkia purinilytica]
MKSGNQVYTMVLNPAVYDTEKMRELEIKLLSSERSFFILERRSNYANSNT